jgi:energy-coupling factor transporter ATP-binding protein EcfA2
VDILKTRVLALVGPIGVGKTTLADNIQQQLKPEDSCLRISFAEPIKKALLAMAGYSIDELERIDSWKETFQELKNEEFLTTGRTWRYAAQTLGTEWGREIMHSDIWSNAACISMAAYNCAIIDDLRFHSESDILHINFDVLTIRLARPDMEVAKTQHISEQEYETMPNVHYNFLLPEVGSPGYNKIVDQMINYLRHGVKP